MVEQGARIEFSKKKLKTEQNRTGTGPVKLDATGISFFVELAAHGVIARDVNH